MSATLVRVNHRGQQTDFVAPVDAPANPVALPLLVAVSDWYERGCIDQINGHQQGESPSATVTLSNPQGATHAALAYPLGATVTIFDGPETLIAGQCVRYSLGPVVELSIEL
jgi:hypothetical protein